MVLVLTQEDGKECAEHRQYDRELNSGSAKLDVQYLAREDSVTSPTKYAPIEIQSIVTG